MEVKKYMQIKKKAIKKNQTLNYSEQMDGCQREGGWGMGEINKGD